MTTSLAEKHYLKIVFFPTALDCTPKDIPHLFPSDSLSILGLLYPGILHQSYFLSMNCRKVTLNDLAVPDAYCSMDKESGYECPQGMVCMDLNLPKSISGFNGFDDFGRPPLRTLFTASVSLSSMQSAIWLTGLYK